VKAISSDANPAFRRWLRMAGMPRAVREEGQTLAEGLHLAQAALAAGVAVAAFLLRKGAAHPELEALLAQLDTMATGYELAPALYDRIAPVEQGAGLMLVLPLPATALPQAARCDMVYLDGVQDPGNAGALIRSAAAAGVRHVLAGPGTAALWAPRVLRAAMGAHFRLAIHERVTPAQLSQALDGPWFAAVAHAAPSLWAQALPAGPLGWIFGAEGSGPTAEALAACHQQVCIPTSAAVESLNVAAAAAICLFERRRRSLAP
jgi:TrmH family RNA methyltransferase